MSFWEKSISDKDSLKRAVTLVTIILIYVGLIAFVVTFSIYKFVTATNLTNVDFNGSAVKINFNGEKMFNVVTVPAYQLASLSGVKLDKQSEIQIRASGLVSTAANQYELDKRFTGEITEAENKILALELQRDMSMGWRYPNGTFIYSNEQNAKGDEDGSKCVRDASDSLKIDKAVDYGYLLAFVKPVASSEAPDQILANKNTLILEIGESASIRYSKDRDQFIIVSGENPKEQTLPGNLVGGEIYFTVNDTIIRNQDEVTLNDNCLKKIKDKISRDRLVKIRNIQKQIIDKYMKEPKTPYAIWYLNNRGFFTVNMLQQPSMK